MVGYGLVLPACVISFRVLMHNLGKEWLPGCQRKRSGNLRDRCSGALDTNLVCRTLFRLADPAKSWDDETNGDYVLDTEVI